MTPQTLSVGSGALAREIAYLHHDGAGPGLVWMQGFMSDRVSTKAAALAERAERDGIALTRFDYSGHGQSGGAFTDGTISRWLEESRAVFEHVTSGPQIVIGSSMGGYLAMLLERQIADANRIAGLVLIAPAWDMTEALMWDEFPADVREQVMETGVWMRPSAYGDPYPITRDLIADGRKHLFGDRAWQPACPVRIIQGRLDPDVPYDHVAKLLDKAAGADVTLTEVPDGEHRLSRPEDIALLIDTIETLRQDVA
ncbi:MAG: alpha/beta hydrolase [Pseudomonadota bacterium]